MAKLTLVIEVTSEGPFYDDDPEEKEWFIDEVLTNSGFGDCRDLILHSNLIGDEIGTVKVLEIKGIDNEA